jgi:ribonuclease G
MAPMPRKLLIESDPHEVRVALLEDDRLVEIWIERHRERGPVGNIYRGRVARVVPGIQAAFVDIGLERNAFLYVGDVRDRLAELAELVGEDEDWETGGRGESRRIDELLSPGQELIVQVRKAPVRNKGARVTTQIALPGRYLVLMPTSADTGISRRIEDTEERERLLAVLDELGPVPGGVIIRTAGEGSDARQLGRDLDYLSGLWQEVAERAEQATAPALVYSELDLARRTVRDRLDDSFEVVWVDGDEIYREVLDEVEALEPRLVDRVMPHEEPGQLFSHFGMPRELEKALRNRIWLKSGGYLVIQQTEALVAIDVNTGRYLGRKSLEETVLHANLEAVEEVARQIRLRDLGGIIVVDFIDMVESENRRRVVSELEDRLKRDRSRARVSQISEFGLVEVTRKRSRSNLRQVLTRPCPCCGENGRIKSVATICLELRRQLLQRATQDEPRQAVAVTVRVPPDVAEALETTWAPVMRELEERLGMAPRLEPDATLHPERFELIDSSQAVRVSS